MAGVLTFTYGSPQVSFSIQDVAELGETLEAPVSASRDITGAQIVQALVSDNLEVGTTLRFTGRLTRAEYQALRQLVASAEEAQVVYQPADEPISSFYALVRRCDGTNIIPTDWMDVTVDLLITKTEVS